MSKSVSIASFCGPQVHGKVSCIAGRHLPKRATAMVGLERFNRSMAFNELAVRSRRGIKFRLETSNCHILLRCYPNIIIIQLSAIGTVRGIANDSGCQ
jgi:hypothetical protein